MLEEPDPYALPPEVEAERLRSLDQLHVFNTPPEDRFAHITRMARVAMGVPMSAINFIDRSTQWCKQYSADHELHFNVPRDQSVCRATIARAYLKPEDPALVYEDLADSEFAELPAIAQEGGVRFYAGFPLFGPGGHPVGTFCVYDTQPRQLTDQERATFEELAAWTQREVQSSDYQRALEIAAVGMCLTEPEGHFIEVNDALCEYFGYDAETLVQKTWQDITAPDFLQADLDRVEDMLAGRLDSYRTLKQFIRADGELIWGDLSVACIRNDQEQVLRFVAQIVDVNEEITARAELDETRRLLAASADSMLDPQVLFQAVRDPDGRITDFTYIGVNRATCLYLQVEGQELLGTSAMDSLPNLEESGLLARYAECVETGEPVILTDFSYFNEMLDDARRYDIQATRAGADLLSLTWSDVTDRFNAAQRLAESEGNYRLLAENIGDVVAIMRDGRIAWISPSCEGVLGAPPAYWVGREVRDMIPADRVDLHADRMQRLATAGVIQERSRVQAADGRLLWIQLTLKTLLDGDGRQNGYTASFRVIDAEVAAEQAAEEARKRQAQADARYRRSMNNAAVGVYLVTPDGCLRDTNAAMGRIFGYDPEAMDGLHWQDFTAPEYLEEEQKLWDGIREGRLDDYRIVKHYSGADGQTIWGDLSVSGIRDNNNNLEYCVALITDITARVEADERNRVLARELQRQNERTKAELDSAAAYVKSILPEDMQGAVEISSRYLPAQELGGDGFHYRWLDDDHLKVYLIDVSGHGIRPALLSASVHNLIRTNSLPMPVMLHPDRVLNRLNSLFPMEDQGDSYFTMFYGIYQPSTRTLRYASAGHPPALALNHDGQTVTATPLSTPSVPIGTFDDTTYTSAEYTVPPGGQVLIYSDGAYEFNNTTGDNLMSHKNFSALCATLAARPDWSLDTLVNELKATTPHGEFDDDCALVLLTFP